MTWQTHAQCRDSNPDIFHPPTITGHNADYRAAARICHGCPVILDCRNYVDAFESGHEVHGYWAQETPRQRETRRRNTRRQHLKLEQAS